MPIAGLDPYACDCGWLAKAADDPSMPIGCDAAANEYYVEMRGSGEARGQAIIKFCPWCGGDAPVSKRAELFHPVTIDDQLQIGQFSKELRTREDVLAKFGKPDEEIPGGYGVPESSAQGARTVMLDVLRYNNVVQSASVDVIVRHDGTVGISYSPRPRVPH
jgi:hypothetical protein